MGLKTPCKLVVAAIVSLLLLAATLLLTVSQVVETIDRNARLTEQRRVEGMLSTLAATGGSLTTESAMRLGIRYGFDEMRLGTLSDIQPGEVAVPLDSSARAVIWRPAQPGSSALRAYGASRIPLIFIMLFVTIAALVTLLTVTHRLELERREARALAGRDSLTGLANRLGFENDLERLSAASTPFTLLYLDLDGFKQVNDRHGHAAGDAVLRVVASRLVRCVGETATVARLGGDEFAVLLVDQCEIADLAKAIVAAVRRPIALGQSMAQLGVSIGVARAGTGVGSGALMRLADAALYRVKAGGGSGFHVAAA
ncbi:hypothetical protein GCM10007989_17650 [Devosia pacifica]|uniref:GGDEF domain-containing protein n=1 Tax=Devosia pacifica TaxID=1335967 RepID=A0A918VRM1_9HYPH|nr:hypothetical protein GCM10007989_17650 [Devosia pacifica]